MVTSNGVPMLSEERELVSKPMLTRCLVVDKGSVGSCSDQHAQQGDVYEPDSTLLSRGQMAGSASCSCRYDLENKDRKSADDEARIKTLYKKFGMWHGISSLNNLVVLAATVAYGWSLAGRLTLHMA